MARWVISIIQGVPAEAGCLSWEGLLAAGTGRSYPANKKGGFLFVGLVENAVGEVVVFQALDDGIGVFTLNGFPVDSVDLFCSLVVAELHPVVHFLVVHYKGFGEDYRALIDPVGEQVAGPKSIGTLHFTSSFGLWVILISRQAGGLRE